jgi:WD40 repeat protein
MAFAPDGRHLALTAGWALSVWDVATGRVVRTISTDSTPQGEGFTHGFTFSRDGKYLLSAEGLGSPMPGPWGLPDRKPVLLLWDYSSGKILSQSSDLEGRPYCLALRHDGRLAACVARGNVLLWRPGVKALRPVFRSGKHETAASVAFSPDGKHLLVVSVRPGSGVRTRRIDVASGRLLNWVSLRTDLGIILAADLGAGAASTPSGELRLFDMGTGAERRLPLREKDFSADLSFSPDGRVLLAWDRWAETVQLWDVAKGQLLRRLRLPGLRRTEHAPLLLSPDGTTLASSEVRRVVRLWDARTGRPRMRLPGHVQYPHELAFSADGRELTSYTVAPHELGEVYRWQAATGKRLSDFALAPPDNYIPVGAFRWRLAPGGRHLALQLHRALHVFDTRTGKRIDLSAPVADDGDWSFTPDGRALVIPGPNRSVRLWDVTTGKLQRRLELEKKGGPLTWLRYSPDGRTLVTGDGGPKVRLWDAATGKHRADLPPVRGVESFGKSLQFLETAFTPEGRYLFVASHPYLLGWDTVTGREVALHEPDEDAWEGGAGTGPVAVSPDGRLLAWFPSSGYLRLYEVCSGRIVHRFEDERYWSAAFAPSGWRLATGCNADGSALVWDLPLLFRSQRPIKDARPEVLWDMMAGDDAAEAHRALWRLAALPGADAFLARRLTEVERGPPERLRALLIDLGSSDFDKRKRAEEALAAAGEAARVALAEAASAAKDPEVRRRLTRLRARLRPPEARRLRELRAVLALEARGTPEARKLLETLARGAAEVRLTQEARASLRRLERRPAP